MKYIVIAIVAIAAYFIFSQDSFDTDLYLDGQTFSHVSKVRGGNVTNHFYTPNGESFKTATRSIQIVELSEDMQDKSMWRERLSPLFKRYNLKPVGNQPYEMAGSSEISGVFFKAYSAPISVSGTSHQAFYLVATSEKPTGRVASKNKEIIDQLKGLEADLN